jgi:hypothetical protein
VNELEKKQTTDQNSDRHPKMYVSQNIGQPLTVFAIVGGLHALIMTSTSRSIIAVVVKSRNVRAWPVVVRGGVIQVGWPRATRRESGYPAMIPQNCHEKYPSIPTGVE